VQEITDVPDDCLNELSTHEECRLPETVTSGLSANEFVILRPGFDCKPLFGRYREDGRVTLHKRAHTLLSPKNKEQGWAFELLYDPNVRLVTITGLAGSGKSLLAIAAGKHQIGLHYDRMLITRPIVPMGKDLGYLPGTIEEKMDPWIAPIKDNLLYLIGTNAINKRRGSRSNEREMQALFDSGQIQIEAVTYIRGRSIPKAFMIIDEAQNLDLQSLKTIITRAGTGTKIVLTGDMDQVDKRFEHGLEEVIERFRPHGIAGHINLIKGERSELASLAAEIL